MVITQRFLKELNVQNTQRDSFFPKIYNLLGEIITQKFIGFLSIYKRVYAGGSDLQLRSKYFDEIGFFTAYRACP
jgi:hypothetical protein